MAVKNYLRIIFIAFVVFSMKKSINKIHVQCDVQQHHIRHFNHHLQHLLQQHRLHPRQKSNLNQPWPPQDHPLIVEQANRKIHHQRAVEPNVLDLETTVPKLHSIQHTRKKTPPPFLLEKNQEDDDDQDDATEHQQSDNDFDDLDEDFDKQKTSASERIKVNCPKCTGTTNVRVSEEELTELRIEFVKNQILQKLRLKERPKITVDRLPRPIYEGTTIHGDVQTQSKDLDDYYARTSQKFIFLEQERKLCDQDSQSPSICFAFRIEGDIDTIDVSTAELWIYKNSNKVDLDTKQTLVVSELDTDENNRAKAKPIAIQSIGTDAGWIKIDIAWATKQWFSNHQLSHVIKITCSACQMSLNERLLSTEKDYRPFILIDTLNRRKIRRQKRNVNCSVGVTECCREKLYISFAEIGWSDWILQPSGYDAYFCRGSCSTAASITMSNSHYSSLLRRVIHQRKTDGKALELIPCCTAKKFSSLQLLYLDSNNTGTVKTLPNMVVESCGCM